MDEQKNHKNSPWNHEDSPDTDATDTGALLAVKKFLDSELQLSDASDDVEIKSRTDISHTTYNTLSTAIKIELGDSFSKSSKIQEETSQDFRLNRVRISSQAIKLIPEGLAIKYTAIPIEIQGDILLVAMNNPFDLLAISTLETVSRMHVKPQKADEEDIKHAIQQNYKLTDAIREKASQLEATTKLASPQEQSTNIETDENVPVIRIVDMILKQALKDRASDIHIEPQANQLRLRFRIDGILHNIVQLPLNIHMSLVSRIKILAKLNIAEHRIPQDGQFSFKTDGREVDVRVAIADTIHGETIVLRLLEKNSRLKTLSQLGLSTDALAKFENILRSPYGMILVGGPTGSGKTTTLYASINQLNKEEMNIITIEDPVEYHIDNIKSMQVNNKAGFNFASGLRSIMRLDPDVILVGEIRDSETAQIAVQAALTGHLVLSTIHANDTIGIIYRMLNLGVESFLLGSALLCLISQRMVRKTCPHCWKLLKASQQEFDLIKETTGDTKPEFYYGQGCSICSNTGYYERTGIFEFLPISENMRNLISTGAQQAAIKQLATNEGMISMLQEGMLKARKGITTPAEVIKNVYNSL